MAEEDDLLPIVIDNGSGSIKAGFAGQEAPSIIMPTLIGRPKHQDLMRGVRQIQDCYVGNEAQQYRALLNLKYPMHHGVIQDWDSMERIWDHVFLELKVDPGEHPLLLSESPMNPRSHGAKMAQIMFETFDVPALQIQSSSTLALYAMGLNTGVVVSCGDGLTTVVPVYEGFSIPHAIRRLDVAGRDATEYLTKLLGDVGYHFATTAEKEIVRDVKESLCFVSKHFDHDLSEAEKNAGELEKLFEHPNGSEVLLTKERFQCPEVIFKPSLIGHGGLGVHEHLFQSIMNCDIDIRRDLYSNIVLAGGSTLFPGFGERLQHELFMLAPPSIKITIHSPEDRRVSSWIGGSVFSSLPQFWDSLIVKQDYEEYGANIIHQKLIAAAL